LGANKVKPHRLLSLPPVLSETARSDSVD